MDQKCLHNNTYTENKKVYQSVANFVVDHEYEYIRDLFSPAMNMNISAILLWTK